MKQQGTNHHCCVVDIDGQGILIEGRPGSGKTSLALGLIDIARSRGHDANLVCDDQAILSSCDGRLLASCPPSIRGLVEIRGFGISKVSALARTPVALAVRLVSDEAVQRMPEPIVAEIAGISVPLVSSPRRHEAQGIRIILAWLQENAGNCGKTASCPRVENNRQK
ncbi:MAG: HPr kinase/phosphorylase [Nitratireductor sp.]|nr:HPr kinase/phosphorylase [Nitratireductor sp.]